MINLTEIFGLFLSHKNNHSKEKSTRVDAVVDNLDDILI